MYLLFKFRIANNDYGKPGQLADLLKEIRRYAGRYACITAGACETRSSAFFSHAFRSLMSQL